MIAIIGILASVVLASLNSARSKGADAAVKSNLNNARAQAELFYDNNSNTYTNVCNAAGGIQTMVNGANNANGAGAMACNSTGTTWAAEAALVSNPALFYCVDSTGVSTSTVATSNIGATAVTQVCDGA